MSDGTTFYSKHQVYLMQWVNMFDLSDYVIAGAKFGGPLGSSFHFDLFDKNAK